MTEQQIRWYEKWLKDNERYKGKRVMGSYWSYLYRYLHDKEGFVDGMSYDKRMEYEPLPLNVYLYG